MIPLTRFHARPGRTERGFALVITLVLLALLVLAVYALSALSRVGAEVSATGTYQMQARQHALLGLGQALGALQCQAGADDRLTGMAGISGIPAGPNQPARHWAGAWDRHGVFAGWLASGADGAAIPGLNGADSLALVAHGSLGAERINQEHVRALRLPVIVHTRDRSSVRLGSYAWVALDEGVKLSVVLPASQHAIDAFIPLSPEAPLLSNTLSYEQIALVPTSVTATRLAGDLRANFHALGRMHRGLVGATPVPGLLNVNTSSNPFWRGVAATYNRLKPTSAPALSPPAFADAMTVRLTQADPDAGKALNGPYPSVELFLGSGALNDAVEAGGGTISDFSEVMRPWLAVRSDTFRVRACGEAVNPADAAVIEATAWCEAIVQRVKDDPGAASGRFIITYFRWLGADDI